jgi:hypothetical protein
MAPTIELAQQQVCMCTRFEHRTIHGEEARRGDAREGEDEIKFQFMEDKNL